MGINAKSKQRNSRCLLSTLFSHSLVLWSMRIRAMMFFLSFATVHVDFDFIANSNFNFI